MKTIVAKIQVPDEMDLPLTMVVFSNENEFFRAEKHIEILQPPTDEEIENELVGKTSYGWFMDVIRGAKWMRSQIFGEDTP